MKHFTKQSSFIDNNLSLSIEFSNKENLIKNSKYINKSQSFITENEKVNDKVLISDQRDTNNFKVSSNSINNSNTIKNFQKSESENTKNLLNTYVERNTNLLNQVLELQEINKQLTQKLKEKDNLTDLYNQNNNQMNCYLNLKLKGRDNYYLKFELADQKMKQHDKEFLATLQKIIHKTKYLIESQSNIQNNKIFDQNYLIQGNDQSISKDILIIDPICNKNNLNKLSNYEQILSNKIPLKFNKRNKEIIQNTKSQTFNMKYDYITSFVHSIKIYDDLDFHDAGDNKELILNDDSDIEMNQMMLNNFANSSAKHNICNQPCNLTSNSQKQQFTFNKDDDNKNRHYSEFKKIKDEIDQSKSDTSTISLSYSFVDKKDNKETKSKNNTMSNFGSNDKNQDLPCKNNILKSKNKNRSFGSLSNIIRDKSMNYNNFNNKCNILIEELKERPSNNIVSKRLNNKYQINKINRSTSPKKQNAKGGHLQKQNNSNKENNQHNLKIIHDSTSLYKSNINIKDKFKDKNRSMDNLKYFKIIKKSKNESKLDIPKHQHNNSYSKDYLKLNLSKLNIENSRTIYKIKDQNKTMNSNTNCLKKQNNFYSIDENIDQEFSDQADLKTDKQTYFVDSVDTRQNLLSPDQSKMQSENNNINLRTLERNPEELSDTSRKLIVEQILKNENNDINHEIEQSIQRKLKNIKDSLNNQKEKQQASQQRTDDKNFSFRSNAQLDSLNNSI